MESFFRRARDFTSVAARADMVRFLNTEVFDETFETWLGHAEGHHGRLTSRRILGLLRTKWPDAIAASNLEEVNMDNSFVSVRFLLDQPPNEFLNSCYALLLERVPDDSAKRTFGAIDFTSDANRMEIINTIMGSEEYSSRPRPGVVHPDQERLADIQFKMRRSTIFYERQIVPPQFFEIGHDGDEVCLGRGVCSIIAHVDPGRWIMRDKLFFLGRLDQNNAFYAECGWVFFGGKFRLRSGKYCLDVAMTNEGDDDMVVDIVSRSGTLSHLSFTFIRTVNISLRFDMIADTDGLEVRLLKKGHHPSRILLDSVQLRRL